MRGPSIPPRDLPIVDNQQCFEPPHDFRTISKYDAAFHFILSILLGKEHLPAIGFNYLFLWFYIDFLVDVVVTDGKYVRFEREQVIGPLIFRTDIIDSLYHSDGEGSLILRNMQLLQLCLI